MKDAKLAVLSEWDEHLRTVHPRQWERELKKRARHSAKKEKDESTEEQLRHGTREDIP